LIAGWNHQIRVQPKRLTGYRLVQAKQENDFQTLVA
jgi:hypothetical protein